jgi:hypothetical protein
MGVKLVWITLFHTTKILILGWFGVLSHFFTPIKFTFSHLGINIMENGRILCAEGQKEASDARILAEKRTYDDVDKTEWEIEEERLLQLGVEERKAKRKAHLANEKLTHVWTFTDAEIISLDHPKDLPEAVDPDKKLEDQWFTEQLAKNYRLVELDDKLCINAVYSKTTIGRLWQRCFIQKLKVRSTLLKHLT